MLHGLKELSGVLPLALIFMAFYVYHIFREPFRSAQR